MMTPTVQVSPRGQITLPQQIRKALGLAPGDTLVVSMEDGSIVLTPAVVTAIELYTDERVQEFDDAARMSDDEIEAARRRWGV